MIRAVRCDELDKFCELAENPDQLRKRLAGMFESKMSSPELCHVRLEDGDFVAGATYINFPSTPGDFGLWGIFKLTGAGDLRASVEFLRKSFQLLVRLNAQRLETQVSYRDDDATEQRALFEACGFQILQVKARYEFEAGSGLVDCETGLHLELFEKVGKRIFINLIADATRDTLDRSQRAEYQRLGAEPWANTFYNLLLAIDDDQSHWRAALIDGQPVGFVIPQMIGQEVGAINYVGVIPSYRGKGLSRDLITFGTADLTRAGARRVIADIDVENFPLARTLATVGYQKKDELCCYLVDIASALRR
jgi:GNAT superfamily N-acetyltransferase